MSIYNLWFWIFMKLLQLDRHLHLNQITSPLEKVSRADLINNTSVNFYRSIVTDTSKLTRQKLGKNIKVKILTAHIQAVRILYGAPDRTHGLFLVALV